MSLLNEALRKKSGEHRQPQKPSPFRSEPKALTQRKTKIYIIAFLFVLASILGALSAIKLFYLPGSSPVKPVKTVEPQKANAVHSQKIIAARKIKPPTAFQAEQKQQPQQEIKLQAMAPGEQKSQHTENNGLITEQKNQTVTGPTQAATPYATEKQKQLNSAIKRLKKV